MIHYYGEFMNLYPSLKDWAKTCHFRCSYRRQRDRYYVTLEYKGKDQLENYLLNMDWIRFYNRVVTTYHTNAVMTSGSSNRVTFFIGTVADVLKG